MTLIITHISRHGIIHASDSNLSDSNGQNVGEAKKCFSIPDLKAGLTIAGVFSVGGISMENWITKYIASSSATSLKEFAYDLSNRLELEMADDEKLIGTLIHICGYAQTNGRSHPEFWFVRNIYHIDPKTGEYQRFEKHFQVTEDFWQRDNKKDGSLFANFQKYDYMYQMYINGSSPGRISYNIIQRQLQAFFYTLWSSKEWKFRPPKNIYESKLLIENFMSIVNTVFLMSDYPGQTIGGPLQFTLISQPSPIDDGSVNYA